MLAAGLALAMFLSGDDLRRIVSFLLGSFANASWSQVAIGLPIILVGTLLIVARARSLDALLLGDEAAAHLGVARAAGADHPAEPGGARHGGGRGAGRSHRLRGSHRAPRRPAGCRACARLVLPLSALFGALFMVVADLIARIPGELPVGIVTALIGVPVFLVLLRRSQGSV